MQNKNVLIAVVIGLVVVLGLGAFLLSQNNATTPTASASPSPEVVLEESASPSASASSEVIEQTQEETVTRDDSGFSPVRLTIKVGTTVTWKNESGSTANVSSDPHPIHTSYTSLNLKNFADGDEVSLTFDKAGTYGYHDHLNPQFKGTIVVE